MLWYILRIKKRDCQTQLATALLLDDFYSVDIRIGKAEIALTYRDDYPGYPAGSNFR